MPPGLGSEPLFRAVSHNFVEHLPEILYNVMSPDKICHSGLSACTRRCPAPNMVTEQLSISPYSITLSASGTSCYSSARMDMPWVEIRIWPPPDAPARRASAGPGSPRSRRQGRQSPRQTYPRCTRLRRNRLSSSPKYISRNSSVSATGISRPLSTLARVSTAQPLSLVQAATKGIVRPCRLRRHVPS